ncbi:Com family DNA-binding transcriptional regulator [Caloramator sp. Dgby_cultured_2]|nr:Com family DNA-binding transcriptional regulator [Caloramator sp. Dgby_cultured_2]WDU82309.1 Com family DNA-binding transcriptional regulator [Caloramator sp. Dgby_cultured_2]
MLENMDDFRCPKCNKLLFKYKLKGELVAQVKCTRCKTLASLQVLSR